VAAGKLPDAAQWDSYWEEQVRRLPVEVRRGGGSLQTDAILDVFDRFLPEGAGGDVLEVGGCPCGYLTYIHRRTGCRCTILDYSPHGCSLARENFAQLRIPLVIHERDVFDQILDIGTFDLVYSLGLIEHFSDVPAVVAAQARLVRPGGLLLLGVPNFRGVNGWIASRLAPRRFATHNLEAMRLETWDDFEHALGLERLFRGPIGGFEPGVFAHVEEPLPARAQPLKLVSTLLARGLGSHFAGLRRFNHPVLSGYLIGGWRLPSARSSSPTPRASRPTS
jgi:SAM-dependent methyltransferase